MAAIISKQATKQPSFRRDSHMGKYLLMFIILLVAGYWIANPSVYIDTQHTYTIQVRQGDTLWDLAAAENQNRTEIRNLIHEIKKINGITDMAQVQPGMYLEIPKVTTRNITLELPAAAFLFRP